MVSNYRPISLTCTSCKIMESVIHNQLISYLHFHKLISDKQHGFLARKSTGTNLLSCFQDWQLSIKSRKLIDIIYIDFQKAFDSLVHSKIPTKLNSYGICYELLYWIQSFLTDRVQRVVIDGVLSNPIVVSSGVVQGSVLGPLIFILFINDIVDCFEQDGTSHTLGSIFADDLKLYCDYNLLHENSSLVITLNNIESWSSKLQLRINPDKSSVMQVGKALHDRHLYVICGKIIEPSNIVRDLGILYNSKLCFNDYIEDIVTKAFQRVNLLFRSFISGNISILSKAYITYVRPLLEYCTYIWSPFQIYLIERIERVQRYFSRRVLCRSRLAYHDRLRVLNLETLELRRITFDLKLCYKIINGLCAIDCDKFFTFAPILNTRGHNFKLTSTHCSNNWLFNFHSNRVVNYWNSLPADVVHAKSFKSFAAKLNSIDLGRFCKMSWSWACHWIVLFVALHQPEFSDLFALILFW